MTFANLIDCIYYLLTSIWSEKVSRYILTQKSQLTKLLEGTDLTLSIARFIDHNYVKSHMAEYLTVSCPINVF